MLPKTGNHRRNGAHQQKDLKLYLVNNMLDTGLYSSGWAAKHLPTNDTSLIDNVATITLVNEQTTAGKSTIREPTKYARIPDEKNMASTDILTLQLENLHKKARRAFRLPNIMNNLSLVA